ncbi:MAG: spermidine/putrescine ABC transporter substrate-binding protein [Theionarchaea archaeon]|nr:spermidine/putrescine ABC transporter substrate-binding protein [Theionarchaea archaeon]
MEREDISIGNILGRREFLKGVAALGALAAAASVGGCLFSKKDELNVYNWSDYIGETTIEEFENEFGVKVNYDNYSSNDELLAKVQAGGTGYDIIVPSDYAVQILHRGDDLEPIDMSKITNFGNIGEKFRSPPFDPGPPSASQKYSIPYQWGTTGIGFNSAKVGEDVDSWSYLWDENYRDRITMLEEMREVIATAFKILGYSVNDTDPSHLQEAKNLLMEQKPLVFAYTSDTYMDFLASGESWLSQGWSGDVYQVAADNEDIRYVIPKEGAVIWMDNMAIPKGAPHVELAHEFINFILRPEVSAGISNYVWYANPNEASHQYTEKEILEDPSIYPPTEVMANLEFMEDLGTYEQELNRVWTELLA